MSHSCFLLVCEIYKRPISISPGFMEAREYTLMRGKCFVSRRHDMDKVADLLWISGCVSGGARFGSFPYFSSNAHGLLQV